MCMVSYRRVRILCLHDCQTSSHETPGEMLALMGPRYAFRSSSMNWSDHRSGSGKTTLLNVLAHRAATLGASVQGQTYVNGSPSILKDFRKLSSFVEQEDALVGSLTVQETLSFAARLALPR